jgi:hypothetical protein
MVTATKSPILALGTPGERRTARERSFADLTGSLAQMIAFASSAMTLYPGTCLSVPMSRRLRRAMSCGWKFRGSSRWQALQWAWICPVGRR